MGRMSEHQIGVMIMVSGAVLLAAAKVLLERGGAIMCDAFAFACLFLAGAAAFVAGTSLLGRDAAVIVGAGVVGASLARAALLWWGGRKWGA